MKATKTARILLALIISAMLVPTLSGCSIIENYINQHKKWEGDVVQVTADSKECVENFAKSIVNGDLEGAKTYMHPTSTPPADEVQAYVDGKLEELDIDFTEDVTFAFDGFEPEINLEHVKYDIKGHATVGGKTVTLKLGVMKDENGLGIYNVTIE